jgi:mannose-6-phosphate isomerase-like protein (cupin superfamily)
MKAAIRRFDRGREVATPERCYINELANGPDDPAVSIAQARVEPGVTTRWHRLKGIVERYVILSGRGRVELGGMPAGEVGRGDVVIIPAMCPQRIASIGTESLVFLAICTPRFVPEAYEELPEDGAGGGAVS